MLPAPVLALLCVAGLATLEGAVATGVVVPEAFRALTGSLDAHGLVHPFSNNKRQIYAFGVNGTDGTTPTGTGIVPVELSEDGQYVIFIFTRINLTDFDHHLGRTMS
jgi:hypothetical protein